MALFLDDYDCDDSALPESALRVLQMRPATRSAQSEGDERGEADEPADHQRHGVDGEGGRQEETAESVPTAPVESPSGIPFLITRAMKDQLRGLDYTDEQISEMRPAEAHRILSQKGAQAGTQASAPGAHPLEPDTEHIRQFIAALFKYATKGTFASLRAFFEDEAGRSFCIQAVAVGSNLDLVNKQAVEIASACAQASAPVNFCPPIATFKTRDNAKANNVAEGLALTFDCDHHPRETKARIEEVLGPATVEVASGGIWIDPDTGEVEDKTHLHYRLKAPAKTAEALAKLKRARDIGTRYIGSDPTGKAICHPFRWPGSWHKKAEPRLCRITRINANIEIDLDTVLEKLEAACPQKKANGSTGPADYDAQDGGDWATLYKNIRDGINFHDSVNRAACKKLKSGQHPGAVINELQGAMEASDHPRDERWQARYNDIERAVRTAQAKFDSGEWTAPHTEDVKSPGDAEIDLSVLHLNRREPPPFPIEILGPFWGPWVKNAAESKACPVDYVASALLSATSSLVGNARWAQAWPGWAEPPHLWCCNIGDSGDGKSPGEDALFMYVIPRLELQMAHNFPADLMMAQRTIEIATAKLEAWKGQVKEAVKANRMAPEHPGQVPEEPIAPKLVMDDVTHEKVALMLARAAPKGVLMHRDEIAGWLLGMAQYSDQARPFWLEAFGGRRKIVDRVKHPVPIDVQRLVVAWQGGIQPDKIAQVMHDADDGLLARFIWYWPDPVGFHRTRLVPDAEQAIKALDRLRGLDLVKTANGPEPEMVPFDDRGADHFERFAQMLRKQKANAAGLMKSTIGKAAGITLRLAHNLSFLHWSADPADTVEPKVTSEEAVLNAIRLMTTYCLPMAERTYGDAARSDAERNTATLAKWIASAKGKEKRPTEIHVRTMVRTVRLPGLTEAKHVHEACKALTEAGWLLPPPKVGFQQGRPREAYAVSPHIWEKLP